MVPDAGIFSQSLALGQEAHLRLTTRTNLAMRTLMLCAANPDRLVRKHEVAAICGASENHLAQVIHLLGKRGFLYTRRGRAGGMCLARPAPQISVGAVFAAFEANVPFADCFEGSHTTCPLAGTCRLHCVLTEALEAFYARLNSVTLADLVVGNVTLHALLRVA